jgi:hypothetical protein
MPRTFAIPSDPFVSGQIRETLATGPEEHPKLDLPKPTPGELLQRWKIKAAAAQSPAHQKAVIEAQWMHKAWPHSSATPGPGPQQEDQG